MGTIDDAFRAAIDKLQELAKETVNSIAEVIEQFFKEWLVEEYPTLEEFAEWYEEYYKEKQEKDKERFFPSDQLAFLVMRTQNTKKPCGDKPHMYWSGFV